MERDQKTEQATPKKRRDERKRGNVFSSKDVVNLVSIFLLFYLLQLYFPVIIEEITKVLYQFFDYLATHPFASEDFAGRVIIDLVISLAITTLPLLAVSMLVSVIATGVQTKFLFSSESLKPKFSRLNPLQGIKRMFSMRNTVELFKSLIKIAVILYVLYSFYVNRIEEIVMTLQMDLIQSINLILNAIMDLIIQVSIVFLVIAGADYMYQRWDYEKNIRMSKQEVKEEFKQMEGDPQVKGKIKQRQRQFAMSRMIQQVPTADVVIRNPTHYAIAMKYDIERDAAPMIVAKGADEVAMRIVRVAEQNGVYVTEEPELTRAIYSIVDLNGFVPFEYYRAVAEVLAFVYQMKEREKEESVSLIG